MPLIAELQEAVERSRPIPGQSAPRTASLKRKREVAEDGARKAGKRSNAKKADTQVQESPLNDAFAQMDSQLLSDYLARQIKKHESELSAIELEDKYIPANMIQNTTAWNKPRSLDNLPTFLEMFSGNTTKLWSASKKNGAPHTIIVAAAGLRAADIARVVRPFHTKEAKVAKLFAKHIKIQDSIKFLNSSRTGIAVGTPTRLMDLMENGALHVDRLERIVIDASHIDQKKRGILDVKEVHKPLIEWIGQKEFRDRFSVEKGGLQLLFY